MTINPGDAGLNKARKLIEARSGVDATSEWKKMRGTVAANKFVLKGSGVEVDYMIGATSSLPALVYKAGAFHKSFKPAEIVSEDTGLGRMVSVSLILSIDTGGERFGFFLPFINVDRGQMAHFHTVGVYENVQRTGFHSASAFDMALHRNERDGGERDLALVRARQIKLSMLPIDRNWNGTLVLVPPLAGEVDE